MAQGLRLLLTILLPLWVTNAHAQASQLARTQSGVSFTLPARFIADPNPQPVPHGGPIAELAFVDGEDSSIRVSVARAAFDGVKVLQVLPAKAGPLPQDFAAGYIDGHSKTAPGTSVVLGEWDPTRHAFSARFTGRNASTARVLSMLPDDHASWQQIVAAGGDIARTRCLLKALIADGDNFEVEQVGPRVPKAAKACQLKEEDVATFVRAQPAGFFQGARVTTLAINYIVPDGMTVVLVAGPVAQTPKLEALMSSIWVSGKVEGASAHEPSRLSRLLAFSQLQPARAAGVALGSMVGGAIMLALFSWLLTKLRAPLAVALALPAALLMALVVYEMASVETPSAYVITRLVGYLLAGLLLFRPLRRWLGARQPA